MQSNPDRSWLEISSGAIKSNLKVFSGIGDKNRIMCVVKANAYGHGLTEVAGILKNEVKWFGVDSTKEALILRDLGISADIVVLGFAGNSLAKVIKKEIIVTVYRRDILTKIIKLGLKTKARINLKVETGLNRQGAKDNDLLQLATIIADNPDIFVFEGLSMHFANVEDTLNPSFAKEQLKYYQKQVSLLSQKGFKPKFHHTSATAASILVPNKKNNLIRLGIGLYGLWPSVEVRLASELANKIIKLRPALSWKSKLVQVKRIKKGESVGYGRTWFAARNSKIAIVPVGYSDGYDRKLSNNSRVIVRDAYAPVIGRVAMNMIVIDVTDIARVRVGDEVTLIGKSKNCEVTAEDLAKKAETINYEIVSRISSSLQRVVTR